MALLAGSRRAARTGHDITRRGGASVVRQAVGTFGMLLAVLACAAIASAATVALMAAVVPLKVITAYWLPLALACALSALLATLFYIARKEADAARWSRFADGLDGRVTPDSGLYTHRVELKRAGRERDLIDQFAHIPGGRREALLMLRQNGSWRQRETAYSAESIRAQMLRIGAHLTQNTGPDLRWVVFADKKGRFAGYQSLEHVSARIHASFGDAVAHLLSAPDAKTFDTRLAQAASLELSDNVIPEGATREDALALMSARGWSDAMIVSRDGKPVGVVTLPALLHDLLMRFLPKERVAALEAWLEKMFGKAKQAVQDAAEAAEEAKESAAAVADHAAEQAHETAEQVHDAAAHTAEQVQEAVEHAAEEAASAEPAPEAHEQHHAEAEPAPEAHEHPAKAASADVHERATIAAIAGEPKPAAAGDVQAAEEIYALLTRALKAAFAQAGFAAPPAAHESDPIAEGQQALAGELAASAPTDVPHTDEHVSGDHAKAA